MGWQNKLVDEMHNEASWNKARRAKIGTTADSCADGNPLRSEQKARDDG
jgi:hypothetical protein